MVEIYQNCNEYFDKVALVAKQFPIGKTNELRNVVAHVKDNNKTIFIAGNGGNATIADHFALGMSLNIFRETGHGNRAYSLNSGMMLSAAANDFGYEQMYAVQLQSLARKGDLFIALSASGNSMNLATAMKKACDLELYRVAIVGQYGKVSELATTSMELGTTNSAVAEDVTMMMLHWLYCSFMGN